MNHGTFHRRSVFKACCLARSRPPADRERLGRRLAINQAGRVRRARVVLGLLRRITDEVERSILSL